ncbi:MAG: NAD(P)-dependent glycerol-1-phosphate dehydrogenase [archaeon]|nr:NAD(P)-dependent glycerol-1-phosphate dehydrogenase [archaeon]
MEEEFTKVRSMVFPRSAVMGHGVISQTADVCRQLYFGKEGLIITGEQTYAAAGRQVSDIVSEHYDIQTVFVGGSDKDNVEKAVQAVKDTDAKFILAVGGGTKIDIAKMVSSETGVPFVSIPTSIAHDGVCSDRASMKDDSGAPLTVQAVPPVAVIGDTEVLVKAPYRYLASGCADVLSNLTALKDWKFANRMKGVEFSSSAYTVSRYAAESILECAPMIKPNMEESVWCALKPIIASGTSMCIAGSSRPTSGSEHMFSHAIDLLFPGKAMHGEQCGVGCIMMMYLHGGDWEKIRDALSDIGAPVDAKGIGLTEDQVIEALMKAVTVRKDRFTILGDAGLTEKAAYELASNTGVI